MPKSLLFLLFCTYPAAALSLLQGNKGKRGEIKIICRNEVSAALLLACVPAPGVSSRVSMALNGTPNTFFAGTEWCGCPCDARKAVGRCAGAELNAVSFFCSSAKYHIGTNEPNQNNYDCILFVLKHPCPPQSCKEVAGSVALSQSGSNEQLLLLL